MKNKGLEEAQWALEQSKQSSRNLDAIERFVTEKVLAIQRLNKENNFAAKLEYYVYGGSQ